MHTNCQCIAKEPISIRIKRMIKALIYIRYFGVRVFIAKEYNILSNASLKSKQKLDSSILRYLKKEYGFLLKKYNSEWDGRVEKQPNAPVWVFWWQGESNMPEILKVCQKSRKVFLSEHPVILLTKDNIKKFVCLDNLIWQKFDAGELRIQHLADIIRVNLLRDYGGLWLDASVFCMKLIPEDYFNYPIYSIKKQYNPKMDNYNVSLNRWTTFVIGGWKNNILCSFLCDFFEEYCKRERFFVDYFLFDCAIALAYENIAGVKTLLDRLPVISEDYYIVSHNMSKVADAGLLRRIQSEGFIFNKISYGQCNGQMPNGSLYDYLREGKFFEKSQCNNSGI